MAEQADAQDLKSCEANPSYRFDSGLRHHSSYSILQLNICIAGWSSLVARRAHNPKVVGSNPAPATKIKSTCRQAGAFCFRYVAVCINDLRVPEGDVAERSQCEMKRGIRRGSGRKIE